MEREVIVTTTPEIPGYKVTKVIGFVHGSSVRTRGIGGKIIAGIEAIVGGRGTAYLHELEKAREEAINHLKSKARQMGANAVIGVDVETTEILEGFIIVTAYGTAVVVKPESEPAQ
ncbi:MAG: YbjQ family protein [Thermoproteales archaeon]|nr:YbjQ family protein [Thermoproteales archaeon]